MADGPIATSLALCVRKDLVPFDKLLPLLVLE